MGKLLATRCPKYFVVTIEGKSCLTKLYSLNVIEFLLQRRFNRAQTIEVALSNVARASQSLG